MDQQYTGKHVLLTGVTGFVGKVVLEKLVWEFPNIGKIYVMVRGKAASRRAPKPIPAQVRFEEGVCLSPIWKVRVRKADEDDASFVARMKKKIVVVQGEVHKPKCAINDVDWGTLTQQLDMIIHCAASIDFNGHLSDSAHTNIGGATELVPLLWGKGGAARRGRGKRVFVHVSTCYVGYPKGVETPTAEDRGSVNEEAVYFPYADEAESLFKFLKTAPADVVTGITPHLLQTGRGGHSNTYTFTKAMAETLVTQRCTADPEQAPLVVIVRPSCVGASVAEPHPGWIDAATANGAMFVCVSLGLLKVFPGSPALISDQIPVDYVTNAILVGAAHAERDLTETGTRVRVIHAGTSDSPNCLQWGTTAKWIVSGFACSHYRLFPQRMVASRPVRWIQNPNAELVRWYYYLSYRIPANLLKPLQILPGTIGGTAAKLDKLASRVNEFIELFTPFTTRQFIFERKYMPRVEYEQLCDSDRKRFTSDPKHIHWPKYLFQMMKGLTHYFLLRKKTPLDIEKPFPQNKNYNFPTPLELAGRTAYAGLFSWLAIKRTSVNRRVRVVAPWLILHFLQAILPPLNTWSGIMLLTKGHCFPDQTCPRTAEKKAYQSRTQARRATFLDYLQHSVNVGFLIWLLRLGRAYTTSKLL